MIEAGMSGALAVAAIASAFACGWLAWRLGVSWRRRMRYRSALVESGGVPHGTAGSAAIPAVQKGTGWEGALIAYAVEVSQRLRSPLARPLAPSGLRRREDQKLRGASAGVDGRLSGEGFWESRVRLAAAGGLVGGVVGCLVTPELGCCLGAAGAVAGWQSLPWALAQRSRHRAEAMERDLSEMLDVMALGMRSGLSFDRSLELYVGHFDTLLGETFRSAHRQWTCGLVGRDEALRTVADSYDSPLLGRVIENVVRSLRFGASLADNLEDAAREARAGYKARREEQVAKAPVKMMVPTGVLILPAMLMLVLGPVLLELAGGF